MLQELSSFGEQGLIGVVILTLGILIVILGILYYIFKTFMAYIEASDKRHIAIKQEFVEAIQGQTQATDRTNAKNDEICRAIAEIGKFIELKNGSMEKFIERTNDKLDACPNNIRRRK